MLNYQRVTDDSPGIPGGSDAICRSQAHVTELPTLELVGTICWRLLSFAKQLRDQAGERKKPPENLGKPWGNPFKSHIRRSNFEAKEVTKFSIFEASLKC